MPVVWTRAWGLSRVYCNALGHKAYVIASGPAHELMRRGLLWSIESKAAANGQDLTPWMAEGNHD